jgi:hypothetical protein
VKRLPVSLWRFIFPGMVAFGMAVFMSAVITAFNTGIDAGFLQRWGKAFAVAFPLAWIAAMMWAPIAFSITARFVTPPSPPPGGTPKP